MADGPSLHYGYLALANLNHVYCRLNNAIISFYNTMKYKVFKVINVRAMSWQQNHLTCQQAAISVCEMYISAACDFL